MKIQNILTLIAITFLFINEINTEQTAPWGTPLDELNNLQRKNCSGKINNTEYENLKVYYKLVCRRNSCPQMFSHQS